MSQVQKTLLTLLVLVGVVGGLLGYAYFGVMKTDEAESLRKDTAERLFPEAASGAAKAEGAPSGEAPSFQALTIQAKGGTTRLEKQSDGSWRLTQPVSARADKVQVDSITSQLLSSKFKDKLEEKPTEQDLEKYGLKTPRFTVTASAKLPSGEVRELEFYGGIENTFDGSVFMRKKGDEAVYSVEGGLRWTLEKSALDLRDKEVLAVDETQLKSLSVKAPANTYALERTQKQWNLTQPFAGAADPAGVGGLLSALKYERAQAFPTDSPEERKRLGLETPRVDARFAFETGEPVRIRLSRPAADAGEAAYALVERGSETVLAELGANALTVLDKNPQELRDKSVLALKQEEVAKITFSPAGKGPAVTVQKAAPDAGSQEAWTVSAPQTGPAKTFKISSALWTLSALKAIGLGEDKPRDWTKYGIAPDSRSVEFYGADGKSLARLTVGQEVDGKPGTLYVRGSRDQVLEIEASRLQDLPAGVADLLDVPAPDAGAAKAATPTH